MLNVLRATRHYGLRWLLAVVRARLSGQSVRWDQRPQPDKLLVHLVDGSGRTVRLAEVQFEAIVHEAR